MSAAHRQATQLYRIPAILDWVQILQPIDRNRPSRVVNQEARWNAAMAPTSAARTSLDGDSKPPASCALADTSASATSSSLWSLKPPLACIRRSPRQHAPARRPPGIDPARQDVTRRSDDSSDRLDTAVLYCGWIVALRHSASTVFMAACPQSCHCWNVRFSSEVRWSGFGRLTFQSAESTRTAMARFSSSQRKSARAARVDRSETAWIWCAISTYAPCWVAARGGLP